MPAPFHNQSIQEIPLKIVGGNNFGRYPKISLEESFNMIVSDNALVDYAGYKNVLNLSPSAPGRGGYASSRKKIAVIVLGDQVYSLDEFLAPTLIGNLETSSGPVFIAENNGNQIAITDAVNIYVYNYNTPTFPLLLTSGIDFFFTYTFTFSPGSIFFQNGRFIVAGLNTTNWVLSDFNNGISWPSDAAHIGELQTKPDFVQAAIPMPGGGNNLMVFGSNVGEQWQDVGAALFPYQRSSTFNVDYGFINASSIGVLENYIVGLAINEQSAPIVVIITGNSLKKVSTDGINYKLANLTNPENCTGFLFKQDGKLIYQFTFIDDNLTYLLDLHTEQFFTATDENLNYHIARKVFFFNNKYYFVSINGGNLYQIDTQFTTYEYSPDDIKQIPRIRICPPIRLPSQRYWIAKSLGFTIENGQPNTITTFTKNDSGSDVDLQTEAGFDLTTEDGQTIDIEGVETVFNTYTVSSSAVDLSISRDGAENFGNSYRVDMNPVGQRKSRFIYQRLGIVNDATFQLRFCGFNRFVVFDGIVEAYQ